MDGIREQLLKSLQVLRRDQGVTVTRLKDHPLLLHALDATADEGRERLEEVIRLAEIEDQNGVKGEDCKKAALNALALGYESGKDITDRRERITTSPAGKIAELQISIRTVLRWEDRAFKAVADLLAEQLAQKFTKVGPFVSLSKETSPLLPVDTEDDEESPEDKPSKPRWKAAMVEFLFRDSPIISMIMLVLLGMIIQNGVSLLPFMKDKSVNDALKDRYAHLDGKDTRDSQDYNIRTSTPASKNMTGGWGPERPTFKAKKPAPYPVLNSITDFPGYGDQRSFVVCRTTDEAPYRTEVQAYDGQVYQCELNFGNAVAPNLDHGNPAAKLYDARARIHLPSGKSKNPSLVGYLSAINSITVWSSCRFTSDRQVTLTYERDTAKLYVQPWEDMPQFIEKYDGDIATSGITSPKGVPLGEKKLDGVIGQTSGDITFNVRVELD